MVRIEQHEDELLYVALDVMGEHHRAEFPHPLIGVDYDVDGRVIGFSASGKSQDRALSAYMQWRRTDRKDDDLVELLKLEK